MDRLVKLLYDLKCAVDIETAVIVSREGKLLKAYPENRDLDGFVQKIAIIMGATEAALMELGKNAPDRIILETGNGKIIITWCGSRALLAAFIKPEADTGPSLAEMDRIAEKIKLLL